MPVAINDFFTYRGFRSNPFATTNAEQEAPHLPAFFVRVDWFDWLVGDPQQPESLILFAPQGYGKTSHRLEVGRRASERQTAPALVVTLNDIGFLPEKEQNPITLNAYIDIIRHKTLVALKPHFLQLMQQQPSGRQHMHLRFVALLHQFVPLAAHDVPPAGAEALIQAFQQTPLSPLEWLKELSALALHIGFASIYVLVDGLDESHLTRNNPAMMLQLLGPLLDAPNLLQECNIAFKFFLPHMLLEHFQQHNVGRLDRIPHRSLEWNDEHLLDMLSRRLTNYSMSETRPAGGMYNFQSFCDVDFDADVRLVQAAQGSPRVLIDLARQIVERHCAHALHAADPISAATINAVLIRLPAEPAPVQATDVAVPPAAPAPAQEPPLLFVDTREDVWIGDKKLENSLTRLLHKCLMYLWKNRQRTITYEELEHALYGNDVKERGDPRSSSEKVVRRLRATLEPGSPTSETYIERRTGVGYVLRRFRDGPADE